MNREAAISKHFTMGGGTVADGKWFAERGRRQTRMKVGKEGGGATEFANKAGQQLAKLLVQRMPS